LNASLADLLGAPLEELTGDDIRQLVEQKVRETDELDFKATLYGKTDGNKIELSKDIAGMRNHRGGVTILGVGDKNGIANGCPEVPLSDGEERRMKQIVAGGTAPHAAFEIRAIEGKTLGKGFYLLIADPSPHRPHAVIVDEGLRFPRRDGTTTRYLSEAEVADMYRDRFRGEKQQIDRLEQITKEALAQLDTGDERAWLVLSLVPNSPCDTTISSAGRMEIEQWAHTEHSTHDLIEGFFSELPPIVGVSVQRYTLTSPADHGKPSKYPYAACYTDGAASVAIRVRTGVVGQDQRVLLAPHLVWATASSLRIAGRHAVRNAGARGDAVVEARVFGPWMLLGYTHSGTSTEAYPGGLLVREARSRLTLPLQSLAGDPQDLLVATRLTLTEILNGFGRAEDPHITQEGALRTRYFPSGYEVREWAERRGVATTGEAAPE
jgi:schlafen family protein